MSHLGSCALEFLQSVLQPLHLLGELPPFCPQQVAVELHELQEALGRGVVEVLLVLLVLDAHLVHAGVGVRDELADGGLDLRLEGQKSL